MFDESEALARALWFVSACLDPLYLQKLDICLMKTAHIVCNERSAHTVRNKRSAHTVRNKRLHTVHVVSC